jgi:hypothetical protein
MFRRFWELIIVLIVLGLLLQIFVETVRPMMPYIILAGIALIAGRVLYRRNQNW